MLGLDVGQPEGADARGVDDPPGPAVVLRQRQQVRRGGGVPTAAGDGVDVPDLAVGVGDQGVDQRGLPDPRVTDQHARAPGQLVAQLGEVAAALGDDPGDPERAVRGQQGVGGGEVGLGQAQQRPHAGVVGGDERSVEQAGPGLGVSQCRHDDQLVGVGDDHPLHGVVVVGGAPQHRRALLDLDDPRQRALVAGHVADHADPVAHHDALAAQGAGLDGHHDAVLDVQREPAPVDGHDDGVGRVVVRRALLGAGAGAAPRPLVVLVVVLGVAPAHRPARLSARRGPTRPRRSR